MAVVAVTALTTDTGKNVSCVMCVGNTSVREDGVICGEKVDELTRTTALRWREYRCPLILSISFY